VGDRQTFRSPFAVAIWWIWVLFAVGNLIDLAVQGRDHLSVVAAFILVLVTGVMYTAAQRPRIIADDDGLTLANPLRDHRIGWAAITAVEATELLRVRCEWPLDGGQDEAGTGKRAIYSWAVHSSRRRQVTAQLRAERPRIRPRSAANAGSGGSYGAPAEAADPPVLGDAGPVVAALSARAEQAQAAIPRPRARPPVSTWYWPALAAIAIPALALVVAILALRGQFAVAVGRRDGRRVGRPRAQPVHVVGGRACLDRGVYQDGQVPRGGQPAFVGVEHVQPGERVPVQGLHPDLDLAVEAEANPVPAIEFLLVDLRNVVERDEHSLSRVLDDRSEGSVPAEILAPETQAPSLKPPGAPLRGVRAAQEHLRRIHVAAVGSVKGHAA
jgi:hypothetical protein